MMDSLLNLAYASLMSVVFYCVVFIPLERAWMARQQAILRAGWMIDLAFMLGQFLCWRLLVTWVLMIVAPWLRLPDAWCAVVASWPWWVQVLSVIAASDLLIYWGHRAQHRYAWLWRFHRTHHTAEHLDWLAAHREHPIDTIYTMGLINLPAILVGFPLWTIAGLVLFRGLWAVLIHTNTRLPLGPLAWLLGAPETHRWHHHRDQVAGNYANLSPLWDIVFGTYHRPRDEAFPIGVNDPSPRNYFALLAEPLRLRR